MCRGAIVVARLRSLCSQIIKMGWVLLGVAVPLYFNPFAIEPFEAAKSALVRWITPIMLAAWTIEHVGSLLDKRRHLVTGVRCVLDTMRSDNPLSLPAITLASVYALASATSIEPTTSIWVSRHRALGTLMVLCYVIIFLIAAERLQSALQRRRLITAILLGSAPIAVYGILQQMGLDIWEWETDSVSRSLSTLGRSNYLGAYLVMVMPLTMAWLLLARWPAVQAACSMLLLLQTVCLILTGARAAWLALVMAGSLFSCLVLRGGIARKLRWMVGLAALVMLVVAMVLTGAHGGVLTRYESVSRRLLVWRSTCDMITDRWLTGYGPGTFAAVFPRYYPEQWRQQGLHLLFDSAHNGLLDLGASTGVLGLVACGWFVFRLYRLGFIIVGKSQDVRQRVVISGCLAGLLAFHVQDLFTPSVVSTQVVFWLLAALLVGLSSGLPASEKSVGSPAS